MSTTHWNRPLTWGLRLLLVVFLVERLVVGDYVGAATLTLFLVLSFAYLLRADHLPSPFDTLVAAAALLNAFGFTFDLWKKVPLYDNVAHAVTIFAVTLAFFYLVYREPFGYDRAKVMGVAVFTFGVTIGALWEIVEWTAEVVLDKNVVFGEADTATDLVSNSLAALAAAALAMAIRDRYPARPAEDTTATSTPTR
jgi:uncharacterized membrane protein YjdF